MPASTDFCPPRSHRAVVTDCFTNDLQSARNRLKKRGRRGDLSRIFSESVRFDRLASKTLGSFSMGVADHDRRCFRTFWTRPPFLRRGFRWRQNLKGRQNREVGPAKNRILMEVRIWIHGRRLEGIYREQCGFVLHASSSACLRRG